MQHYLTAPRAHERTKELFTFLALMQNEKELEMALAHEVTAGRLNTLSKQNID
jgi:hypothetical protein